LALGNWGEALRQSGHPKEAEQRLLASINLSNSLLDQLAANPRPGQNGRPAIILNIRYARSEAELELGLLLKADQERRTQATAHFDRAITELTALVQAFPRVANYRKSLSIATRGRDDIQP
jgi:tetratricopeptide (TPR) repeat protein